MGVEADIEHDLAELGGPAFGFGGARHESRMVMDGLGERGLEGAGRIENAIVAVGEPAWPVGADIGEGRHHVARPGPADAAIRRRSEEHPSELQSLMRHSYAVFCLKKTTKAS